MSKSPLLDLFKTLIHDSEELKILKKIMQEESPEKILRELLDVEKRR